MMDTPNRAQRRAAARATKGRSKPRTQPDTLPGALVGFGIAFDPRLGRDRNWYQNEGDVKRWAENGQPMENAHGPQ